LTSPIDISFYFPDDAGGRDPDKHSPTLRRYHQLLWSKPLPDGREFDLEASMSNAYLHHKSEEVGEFFLASDSVIHTFRDWKRTEPLIRQMPRNEIDRFYRLAYSIGAMLVFPENKIDGKMTINGARGFNQKICDRLDLTLECIRRHYLCEESPLAETLDRYRDFFDLFIDFRGYTEFFLLQDLVAEEETLQVKFFTDDFDEFASVPLPGDVSTYRTYGKRSMDFVKARNRRISVWAERLG
jgi:hypothetical protein